MIVNTCAFIDEAKRESIDAILEVAARKGKGVGKLLVAGCMVNRFGEELARDIPEIDGFISLDSLRRSESIVNLGGAAPPPSPSHMVFDHTAPRLLTTRGYAYLKVAEGCDNPCTFCAIPLWRGRFRSRTIESLVNEARQLEAQGIGELCLIAQDTTRYGEDLGLRKAWADPAGGGAAGLTGFKWIRFLYAYPTTLDEQLLQADGAGGAPGVLRRHAAPAQPSRDAQGDAPRRQSPSATRGCSSAPVSSPRTSSCAPPSSSASPARPRSTSTTCSTS